jgi:hypothetical protein
MVITKITNIEDLIQKTKDKDGEFNMMLKGRLYSKKTISYNPRTKKFKVINHIDNSKQYLTKEQLMDKSYTNIGYALTHNALYIGQQ